MHMRHYECQVNVDFKFIWCNTKELQIYLINQTLIVSVNRLLKRMSQNKALRILINNLLKLIRWSVWKKKKN